MVTEGGAAGAEDMQHEHLRLQESRNAMVTLAAPPRAANREMLHEPRVTSMEGSRQLRCGRETTALGNLRCFDDSDMRYRVGDARSFDHCFLCSPAL